MLQSSAIAKLSKFTRKSSDLAGIQQNLLSNIDRYSKAELKTALQKFEVVFQPANFEVIFQNIIIIKKVAF